MIKQHYKTEGIGITGLYQIKPQFSLDAQLLKQFPTDSQCRVLNFVAQCINCNPIVILDVNDASVVFMSGAAVAPPVHIRDHCSSGNTFF